MHLYDVLRDERDFKISVNQRTFFHEPLFPILELVLCCQQWLRSADVDFVYSTLESEDNPLLALRRSKGGWRIKSAWQKFECDTVFSDNDVQDFVRSIVSQVVV